MEVLQKALTEVFKMMEVEINVVRQVYKSGKIPFDESLIINAIIETNTIRINIIEFLSIWFILIPKVNSVDILTITKATINNQPNLIKGIEAKV